LFAGISITSSYFRGCEFDAWKLNAVFLKPSISRTLGVEILLIAARVCHIGERQIKQLMLHREGDLRTQLSFGNAPRGADCVSKFDEFAGRRGD
jgi:hypothetical protein